jgi:hypothetical protein
LDLPADGGKGSMKIDKRHKIATLMAAIARVPDPKFNFAGYGDKELVRELSRLVSGPDLSTYALHLDKAYGKCREFEIILGVNSNCIQDGREYLKLYKQACKIRRETAEADNLQSPDSLFSDNLPSITSVMTDIDSERGMQ